MNAWDDLDRWGAMISGERCPICLSIDETGVCRGTVVELPSGYLSTQPDQPLRGYCCLVFRRHAVELHDLEDAEAEAFMRDMRRVGRALQAVTGAVKLNLEIHGNTVPHLHVHFDPRRAGDRFEGGPVDARREPVVMDRGEFQHFVAERCGALEGA